MTPAQRDRAAAYLRCLRDTAANEPTRKSYEDQLYWLGVNWRTMVLARDLGDFDCNNAETTA